MLRPYPPPADNPCWCSLGDHPEPDDSRPDMGRITLGPISECPLHGNKPWPPPGPRDAWRQRIFYWCFAQHDHGVPLGEPDGPHLSLTDALNHLLPTGLVVQSVAYSGTWLGERAAWPVAAGGA